MAVYARDTFTNTTGAARALNGFVADFGGAWSAPTALTVNTSNSVSCGDANVNVALLPATVPSGNHAVETQIALAASDSSGGVIVRYQSATSYYTLVAEWTRVALYLVTSSGRTLLASYPRQAAGLFETLRLEVAGANLRGFVNGALRLFVANSTIGASGSTGFLLAGVNAFADTYRADDILSAGQFSADSFACTPGSTTSLNSTAVAPEVGQRWGTGATNFNVATDHTLVAISTTRYALQNTTTPPSANYAVQGRVKRTSTTAAFALYARATADFATYYRFQITSNFAGQIQKYVGGTLTTLATVNLNLSVNTYATFRLEVVNNKLTAFVNDNQVGTVNDASITDANFAGLDAGSESIFDDFNADRWGIIRGASTSRGLTTVKAFTPTAFVADTFSGETTTPDINLHVPEIGGSWVKAAGTVIVKAESQAYAQGPSNVTYSLAYNDRAPPTPDYTVNAILGGTTAMAAVVARWTSAASYQLRVENTTAGIYYVEGTTATALATWTIASIATAIDFTLEVVGSRLRAYRNGTLLGTVEDSRITEAGRAGLAFGPNGQGDNFAASRYEAPKVISSASGTSAGVATANAVNKTRDYPAFNFDQFTTTGSSNVALNGRVAPIGGTWTANSGLVISAATRSVVGSGAANTLFFGNLPATPPSADYSVEGTISFASGAVGAGLGVRATANQRYTGLVYADRIVIEAYTAAGGFTNPLIFYRTFVGPERVKIEAVGNSLRIYINGILKAVGTDNRVTTAGTPLLVAGNNSYVDDYRASESRGSVFLVDNSTATATGSGARIVAATGTAAGSATGNAVNRQIGYVAFQQDDFNTTGSTAVALNGRTAPVGGAWSAPTAITISPTTRAATVTGQSAGSIFLATLPATPPTADYFVETTIALGDANSVAGVIARLANNSAYRFFSYGDSLVLQRAINGVGVTNIARIVRTYAAPEKLRLEVVGTSIRGYVNNKLTLLATDTQITNAGIPGLFVGNNTTADDYTAKTAAGSIFYPEGVASASARGVQIIGGKGSAAGSATAQATGERRLTPPVVGSSAGSATAQATGSSRVAGKATAAGSSLNTARGVRVVATKGTSAGTAAASGDIKKILVGYFFVDGMGVATAQSQAFTIVEGTGTAAGRATVTGKLKLPDAGRGVAAGSATASAAGVQIETIRGRGEAAGKATGAAEGRSRAVSSFTSKGVAAGRGDFTSIFGTRATSAGKAAGTGVNFSTIPLTASAAGSSIGAARGVQIVAVIGRAAGSATALGRPLPTNARSNGSAIATGRGQRIVHSRFGAGGVANITGSGAKIVASVFSAAGRTVPIPVGGSAVRHSTGTITATSEAYAKAGFYTATFRVARFSAALFVGARILFTGVVPAERTFTITVEGARVVTVTSDDRLLTVGSDDRTITVAADDRTILATPPSKA